MCAIGRKSFQEVMGTVDFSTMDLEKKKRRMGSPQSTMARPRIAGMGSCIRIIKLITAHPSRKTTGAAGNHQARTRSCKRKREAAERARKHTAEKMMKERMRSKAPKQRTSKASPVCNRMAFAGVPKRGCSRPQAEKNAPSFAIA